MRSSNELVQEGGGDWSHLQIFFQIVIFDNDNVSDWANSLPQPVKSRRSTNL